MKSFASALILGAAAITLLAAGACGDDSETSSTATGGGSSTSASSAASSPTSGPGSPSSSGSSSNDGGGTPATSTGEGAGGPGSTGAGGDGAGPPVLPGDFDCNPAEGDLPNLVKQTFATIPGTPLQMRQAPGDNDRYFVVAKNGVIYVVQDGVVNETPFLNIDPLVVDSSEQGLLGLAFHPDYQENGRFFVNYTSGPDNPGETYVAEYTVSDDPNVANPTEVERIIQAPAFNDNHNGGAIEVGPDGFLYVSVGDGGNQGDGDCQAMDLDSRLGKILRADISTPGASAAAPNGFPGADEYVYNVGFRNPWRMSFDVCNGNLWIGDVGQGAWEEIDVQPPGAGPQNFGWSVREGAHDYTNACPQLEAPYVEPVLDYSHDGEGNSVTGGYVYRGSAIPALRGSYIFGDYGSGRVWITQYRVGQPLPGAKIEIPSLQTGGVVAFAQDNQGEVYILHQGGEISRIVGE